jgi:hypothetical protein
LAIVSRKSRADLKVVPPPGCGRPEPPRSLDAEEAAAWKQVIDSMPDQWADGGAQILLRRVASMAAYAERDEARLRQLATSDGDHLEVEIALRRLHRATTRELASILGALRATPKSRMRSRDSGRAFARSPSGRRPWEVRAPTIDAEAVDGDETG